MERMEIRGRCGTAIVYAKVIEEEAVEQIRRMCDYEFTEGASAYSSRSICATGASSPSGRGDPDWNWSAPHGAGRLMSRTAAKENLSMEEFRETMADVYTTAVNENTIDEAPMAYKSLSDIIDVIEDSVDVIEVLKPIYNFKAG